MANGRALSCWLEDGRFARLMSSGLNHRITKGPTPVIFARASTGIKLLHRPVCGIRDPGESRPRAEIRVALRDLPPVMACWKRGRVGCGQGRRCGVCTGLLSLLMVSDPIHSLEFYIRRIALCLMRPTSSVLLVRKVVVIIWCLPPLIRFFCTFFTEMVSPIPTTIVTKA